MKHDCTVIMAQWNRSDYTIRSLQSLIDSCYEGEVVIIDANSDEPHWDALRFFVRDNLKLKYELLRLDRNISIGHHKNIGIRLATTKYVLVTDNDMEYLPDWFDKAVELKERSGADILGLWRHPHHGHVKEICEGVDMMNNVPGNCFFSNKDLYEKVGYLKEIPAERYESELGEDSDIVFRLHNLGMNVFSVKENLLHHFGAIRSDGGVAIEFR